jgi:predicted RNase H-like HicB family nuclease
MTTVTIKEPRLTTLRPGLPPAAKKEGTVNAIAFDMDVEQLRVHYGDPRVHRAALSWWAVSTGARNANQTEYDLRGALPIRMRNLTKRCTMQTVKFVYWKGDKFWLGYIQDYPDYWTQGKTLKDLKEHLKDLYLELTNGQIPGVRKVDDLVIA